jgi:hypothetical protein
MALMSQQALSSILNATYSAPTTSDTVTPDSGLVLHVKVGGTATTITIVVPGNQPYTGTATGDLSSGSISNTERFFFLSPANNVLPDPTTGLINVTYSQVTGVTAALLKVGTT